MNLIELSNKFPTELEAVQYLEKKRWGKSIKCPYCKSKSIGNRQKDLRFPCDKCGRSFSVTTGTQLHDTRLPVKTWLMSFAIITDAKKGISALQLHRNIGVHYETAWNMYHKIREFMNNENSTMSELNKVVEMDETYIGGKPRKQANSKCLPQKKRIELDQRIKELKNQGFEIKKGTRNVACDVDVKRGRGTKKIPVVGIVERNGNVVAEVMRNLTYENLSGMVKRYVDEDDAVLITDEYSGYNRIDRIIEHVKIDHKKMYSYRGLNTNSIESFWAIIKRQIIGQHHQVSVKHLPKYVAEAVFKYNNRNDNNNMFDVLVEKALEEN